MKKLILVFAAIAITGSAYAQIDSTKMKSNQKDMNKTQNSQNNAIDKSQTDGVVMQNGKMMKMKNGQMTVLDQDMTMTNGTKIMRDGSYIKKDGSKMSMKEGERFDMSGNIIPVKDRTDKNMYLVPDSTKNKK